jgi:hypothetical protein
VTETAGNRQLAARARETGRQHPRESTAGIAAAVASVALATTSTVKGARKAITDAYMRPQVRDAALALLDELTHQEDTCA